MEVLLFIMLLGWLFGSKNDDNRNDYEKRRNDEFWGRCWDEDHNR